MKFKSFLVAIAAMFAVSASAQDAAASQSDKDRSEQAELLGVAGSLVQYGYQTQSALPLIQAVEIYNKLGVQAGQREKESTSDAVTTTDAQPKAQEVQFEPAKILADAKKFAAGDKNLEALIKKAESASRGAVPGPQYNITNVNALSTDRYTIRFRGGEYAWVRVVGDGDTDLDLYVYDENGNLIGSDTDGTDNCLVTFTPRWTGPFIIRVKNLGRVYNHYVLTTN